MRLFSRDADYLAFEKVIGEAQQRHPMRLLAFCLMPNHWHLIVWPREDDDLSRFMFWMTMTHTQRWRHARKLVGLGPLYQGRFKAFAIEADGHYLTACRYVERNPLRAGLVKRGEHWQWSSLWARLHPERPNGVQLFRWPVDEPKDWLSWINEPQTDAEVDAVRQHMASGKPYGSEAWRRRTARQLGIELEPNPRGRPPKG